MGTKRNVVKGDGVNIMKEIINKVELFWKDKYKEVKIEPRILIEDKEKSYGDPNTKNMLIHGDNLLALKALENDYAGKIKCIYIDPPYNINVNNEHFYDDISNSEWLSLMKPRIELLYKLLSENGIMAIQIDDNQYARLYVLLTELFGQQNLKTIVVKMSEATGVKMSQVIKSGSIPKMKEYIILVGKNKVKNLNLEKIPKDKWDEEYKNYIKNVEKEEIEELKRIVDNKHRTNLDIKRADEICSKFELVNVNDIINENKITKKDRESWLYKNAWRIVRTCSTTSSAKEKSDEKRKLVDGNAFVIETSEKKLYIIKKDYNELNSQPRIKLLFANDYLTINLGDLWTDIKTTGLGNEGGVDFTNSKKPEALIKRIINMCSNPGDFVLDSFLGSGTTVAVANKMGRKWIGIEMGEHCYTHCLKRLESVIDGEQSGISKSINWKGGGGFKFYELAPSL